MVNVYVRGTVHVGNWTRLIELISLLTGTFKFFAWKIWRMAGEKEQILPACSSSSKFFHNLILNVSFLCGGTSHLARVGTLRCTAMRTVFYKFNNALVFRFLVTRYWKNPFSLLTLLFRWTNYSSCTWSGSLSCVLDNFQCIILIFVILVLQESLWLGWLCLISIEMSSFKLGR